ncbi:MAG: hypothetical protein K0Q95_1772 [Bacteroidota bacterium]|jgi:uncharacterized protein YecE (DUF72 family)|nr:hypothetical protein [Bacteroidota bacterium]
MQFGSVESVKGIDFSLPADHPDTIKNLGGKEAKKLNIYVGCAKWNRTDLKNFYPKGTKDELEYYATQFNSIELNASFYTRYPKEQFEKWRDKTPKDFKFFPKVIQDVSHKKRLNDAKQFTDEFLNAVSGLDEKLGMLFLQLPDNFKPKFYDRLESYINNFPKHVPLAVELRNEEWFTDKTIADKVAALFKKNNVANVIVDTAGRRDIIHMRLTSPVAFIRYVGANDKSDYDRLDPWIDRISKWKKAGLKELYFFVHQNVEVESPLLSAYFIEKLNKKLGVKLHVPVKPELPVSKFKAVKAPKKALKKQAKLF